ncbi:MAG: helix-turn-helix transcriptional regulator [Ruminococcaceae bacterium]|nr:helix-turn-helix transcriptional regulator [Oscillospiraceae bacterium]
MFDVSNRIKELRINRGLTVNGLANLAGISQSYLREIELGNKKPTIEYLEYICDALNISLVAFFDVRNNDEISETISLLNKKQKEKLSEFIKSLFL